MSTSWVLIGNGTLLAGCGDVLLSLGERIAAVVTREPAVEQWAAHNRIRIERSDADVTAVLGGLEFDHLASIANLSIIPVETLRMVRGVAINFHDGPLPQLAGVNVTSWAILRDEKVHGVTWHQMTARADAGRILEQRLFDIAADDTAFILNTKCYAAGLESFGVLARRIVAGDSSGREQDLADRQYFGRDARPAAAAAIQWHHTVEEISALVRALDFGAQWNPLGVPKLWLGGEWLAATRCSIADQPSGAAAGTLVAVLEDGLQVAAVNGDVILRGLTSLDGTAVACADVAVRHGLRGGATLPSLPGATLDLLSRLGSEAARSEQAWRDQLTTLAAPEVDVPAAAGTERGRAIAEALIDALPEEQRVDAAIAAVAVLAARRSGMSTFDIAYSDAAVVARVDQSLGVFSTAVPMRVSLERDAPFAGAVRAVAAARAEIARRGPLAADLPAREPLLRDGARRSGLRDAAISIGVGVPAPAGRLRVSIAADGGRCDLVAGDACDALAAQLEAVLLNVAGSPDLPIAHVDLMTAADRVRAVRTWNDTARPVPDACIHELIAGQAARTPDATALIYQGRRVSYRELDAETNRLARHLRALGVGPGVLVGIFLNRSCAMVEAVLATLKAGGAYVPLDPTYPADRIAFMAEDAALRYVLTEQSLAGRVPPGPATILNLDVEEPLLSTVSPEPLDAAAGPSDLAYVIYTSGSTGRPKGVMVEHRNVTNFAVGMDEHIDAGGEGNTWLAVTSLSFDISVLELLWTLARGFAVVIHRDRDRESFVAAPAPARPIGFSLFYFSSDESEHATDKYRLLLEGARFADANAFVAVWTPERHFHAFGGLFPNPAVTSAAVASITRNVGIRAGSVVSPLHSVLRIAEEWSVVDNISNGRVAISFAPGWQPNDFVLRPESFAKRKDVMFEQIDAVRRLWRGETLPFVNGSGEQVDVRILPRPVQKELPVWVTIAGNPESFVAAGRVGANVLTHLLGQTVQEVAAKIELYRQAWRDAGHGGEGTVTLMVHTFVGESDDAVREVVRRPMKEYLRSAVGLVREAAWSFPTFKQKSTNAKGEFDADQLSPDDFDALLDHAFERYYSTSGLFGSVATARRFVEGLRTIGVNEMACLIDFGVPSDAVLAHLPRLAQVAQSFAAGTAPAAAPAEQHESESIPSLIETYGVTHFQCTPTLAQIVLQDTAARPAFGRLRQMLVGGEALPGHLARELASTVAGLVTNVYGPTETTVWSSTARVGTDGDDVTIGFPIANTILHVVDRDGRLAPAGLAGELCIGGRGVVRGYLNRPELTAERFVEDPFCGGRMYRTGDLVRRRTDGALEFLGRLDHQVKIRGHRIELGEIEARLRELAAVKDAVVVARDDGAGLDLVAYVLPGVGAFDETAVRSQLRARLPEYMTPQAFVTLAAFPMTPNRKIDRKALPAPRRDAVSIAAGAPPEGTLEQTIAAIWCEVLDLPAVGVDTNFADVGGHSLAMVQVLGRLAERVNAGVKLVDLFRYTTVRSLARFLSSAGQPDETVTRTALRAASRRAAMARTRVRVQLPQSPAVESADQRN